jgi:hypothetical protein
MSVSDKVNSRYHQDSRLARKLSQLQDNLASFDVSLKVNASEFSGFEEFEIKDSIVPPSGTTHSVACCKG